MKKTMLWMMAAPLVLVAGNPVMAKPKSLTSTPAKPISAQEREQGTQAHAGIMAEYGGAYKGPQAVYVERVGRRIATQSGLSASPEAFEVTLLNSPVNNAFAIPGGYVYVTRDLMALMNDEAELAAVLGHEVAHVAARHSKKRQSAAQRNAILGTLGQVLVGAVAGGNSALGGLLSQGIGTGAQLATLGFSRKQETQADDIGIRYLASAGYEPAALSSMLYSLAAQTSLTQQIAGSGRVPPAWASTHPDPAKRVRRATTQAAAARVTKPTRSRDTFLNAIDGMMYGDDPDQGMVVGRDFLHPSLGFAFTAPVGFAMQNGGQAVSITGPNAQAQFATAPYTGNLDSYISSVLTSLAGSSSGTPQVTINRTTVNNLPAAYAQVRGTSGQSQVDVTVYAYAFSPSRAFHFVALTPAGQGIGAMNPMLQSMRRISKEESASVKPRFVRVVAVKNGDTIASLARRMAFTDYQTERFMVLNGLKQGAILKRGDRVKIITY